MPRPRQAHGRPGTRVIPKNWGSSHAPVMEKTMTDATCELREPGTEQVWDDPSGQMVQVPKVAYYIGGCQVQALTNDARVSVQAEDPESVANYLVTVPAIVGQVRGGHLLKVTTCDDPALTDRVLVVRDVVRGSHRFERDLFCTLTD